VGYRGCKDQGLFGSEGSVRLVVGGSSNSLIQAGCESMTARCRLPLASRMVARPGSCHFFILRAILSLPYTRWRHQPELYFFSEKS